MTTLRGLIVTICLFYFYSMKSINIIVPETAVMEAIADPDICLPRPIIS